MMFALALAAMSGPIAPVALATGDLPEPRSLRPSVTFEANRGQADAGVQFVARSPGAMVFLKPTEATIAVTRSQSPSPRSDGHRVVHEAAAAETVTAAVRMTLLGADPTAKVQPSDPFPVRTNYVSGTDPGHWLSDVPTYGSVRYEQVYPDIDVVYHARDGQLEYDFVVAPGGDPQTIRLGFEGATSVEIDSQGALVLHTPGGDIRKPQPLVYQDDGAQRHSIAGRYMVSDSGRVTFDVAPYDPTLPLVIDPVIAYSMFLGGTDNDEGRRIAVDIQGNVYVIGSTLSTNFPVTAGAAQTIPGGSKDVFVTKFSPTGAVIYSTYIGGNCEDSPGGIAVDRAGNAYVTGRHKTCWNASTAQGAFVVKLAPMGAAVYHNVLAASYMDDSWGQAVAVDGQGNVYVTGVTSSYSRDFPTTLGAYRTTDCANGFLAGYDGFVTKLDPNGTMIYSTYLCGTMNDSPNAIKVDAAGSAYVVGSTESHDFPLVHPIQALSKTSTLYATGFVTKLKPDGSGLVFSTYLGGSYSESVNDVALDGAGNVYVTGDTQSDDFPVTPGVIQPKAGFPICVSACSDAFATKINATGTGLVYSTYISAEDDDVGMSIAVDAGGNAYVAGATWSRYLPIVDAFQSANRGSQEGFIVKLNPTGTRYVYASYLGGSRGTTESLEGEDGIVGIALDGNNNAYVTGYTLSRDFPVTGNAAQRTLSGGACDYFGSPCSDAFMTKITAGGPGVAPKVNVVVTPTDVATGGVITASWSGIATVTNDDWLNLYVLGGLSDSTYRVASWRTTGATAGTLQLALPAALAPGWYELRLLSPDPKQFGTLGVVARSAPIKVGPHADVVVTAVTSPPAVAVVGSSFTVTDTTANRGTLASTGSFTRFYLSLDRTRNTGDRLVTGFRSVSALAPNATSTGTTTITVPATTPVGTYVLLACADDTSTNVESNESNNCTASAGLVSVRASDLAAVAVSNPPASARVGGTFTVTDSTQNRGTTASAGSMTRYYLSIDRVKGTGDRLLTGVRSVPTLAPNAVSTGSATVTIATTTTAGTYFLLACADDTNVSIESNETNNCVASASAVAIAP
jgi:hypothetical protein